MYDLITPTKWNVTANFNAIELESVIVIMAVNEDKTKYMISKYRIVSKTTSGNYSFDVTKELAYLDYAVTSKNDVSLDIIYRLNVELFLPRDVTMV